MAGSSEIAESLVKGDIAKTEELTKAAIDANIPAQEILNRDVVAGMQVVSEQFGGGEIFLPELLMAREAAIGTVQGDVHDIGKNIVIMMLEANGWEVTDDNSHFPQTKTLRR